MKKYAILTFDYEVFLGVETGSIEKSVIEPTTKIVEILRKNKAKSIFFVDTAWLLFLKRYNSEEFQLICNQLIDISASGSTIEFHIHPQWLDAYYSGNKIKFKSHTHYKLQSLHENDIFSLFKESLELLHRIAPNKITCFRAGGWCIEPFDKLIIPFEKYGIKYDFSVLPGMSLKNEKKFEYDFESVPQVQYYKFLASSLIVDPKGLFYEIPISTYRSNPIYRILNKILLKLKNDKIFGDGKGIEKTSNNFISKIIKLLSFPIASLTIDCQMHILFRFLLTQKFKNIPLIVIVSHPKTTSKQALLNLDYIARNYITLNSNDLEKLTNGDII